MAKQALVSQSTGESKIYLLDFSSSLPTGVSVTDCTFTYSGDNAVDNQPTFDVDTIDSPLVYVSVSGLEVGQHRLSCVATTDNADLSPEIMLLITVNW